MKKPKPEKINIGFSIHLWFGEESLKQWNTVWTEEWAKNMIDKIDDKELNEKEFNELFLFGQTSRHIKIKNGK